MTGLFGEFVDEMNPVRRVRRTSCNARPRSTWDSLCEACVKLVPEYYLELRKKERCYGKEEKLCLLRLWCLLMDKRPEGSGVVPATPVPGSAGW